MNANQRLKVEQARVGTQRNAAQGAVPAEQGNNILTSRKQQEHKTDTSYNRPPQSPNPVHFPITHDWNARKRETQQNAAARLCTSRAARLRGLCSKAVGVCVIVLLSSNQTHRTIGAPAYSYSYPVASKLPGYLPVPVCKTFYMYISGLRT